MTGVSRCVGDASVGIEEVRDRIADLDELTPPGLWLANEGAERLGAIVVLDDDRHPPQIDELRLLIGKDPDRRRGPRGLVARGDATEEASPLPSDPEPTT